jgi:hypothetical protein
VELVAGQGEAFFGKDTLKGRKLPKAFHARVRCRGREMRIPVVPDLIARLRVGDRESILLIEADRGTMPVRRRGLNQSSIHRKLAAYARLLCGRTLRRSFPGARPYAAFICENGERQLSIEALLASGFRQACTRVLVGTITSLRTVLQNTSSSLHGGKGPQRRSDRRDRR